MGLFTACPAAVFVFVLQCCFMFLRVTCASISWTTIPTVTAGSTSVDVSASLTLSSVSSACIAYAVMPTPVVNAPTLSSVPLAKDGAGNYVLGTDGSLVDYTTITSTSTTTITIDGLQALTSYKLYIMAATLATSGICTGTTLSTLETISFTTYSQSPYFDTTYLSSTSCTTGQESVLYSCILAAFDVDTNALEFSISGAPSGMTLVEVSCSSISGYNTNWKTCAKMLWTPTVFISSQSITVTVTDDVSRSPAITYSLTITNSGSSTHTPAFLTPPSNVQECTSVPCSFSISTIDYDNSNSQATVTFSDGRFSVDVPQTTVTYMTTDQYPGYSGVITATATATNSLMSTAKFSTCVDNTCRYDPEIRGTWGCATVTGSTGSVAQGCSLLGGDVLTISGTRFTVSTASQMTITVGSKACTNANTASWSDSTVYCTLPGGQGSSVIIEMSITGRTAWTNTAVGYQGVNYNSEKPQVSSITPVTGGTSGGASIVVTGTSFIFDVTVCVLVSQSAYPSGSSIDTFDIAYTDKSTYFPSMSGTSVLPTTSVFDDTELVCTTPAVDGTTTGSFYLGVCLQDDTANSKYSDCYFDPTVSFAYTKDIVVTGVSPTQGHQYGQYSVSVTVTGVNWQPTDSLSNCQCKFGSNSADATSVTFFGNTTANADNAIIECVMPEGTAYQTVSVYASKDNVEFSVNTDVTFYYTLGCQAGEYCAGSSPPNDATPCPAGNQCPSARLFTYYSCAPGTYQPSTGQSSCLTCPRGYQCPDAAMTSPNLCDAGRVCLAGTIVPTTMCPAGYYCLSGTESDIYNDPLWTVTPQLCPAGYYCLKGTNASTYDAGNPSSPKACSSGYQCPAGSSSPTQNACPAGSYCPGNSTLCATDSCLCPAGSYCPSGSATYITCPSDTYQDLTGQSSCTTCPTDTTSSTGSTSLLDCLRDYSVAASWIPKDTRNPLTSGSSVTIPAFSFAFLTLNLTGLPQYTQYFEHYQIVMDISYTLSSGLSQTESMPIVQYSTDNAPLMASPWPFKAAANVLDQLSKYTLGITGLFDSQVSFSVQLLHDISSATAYADKFLYTLSVDNITTVSSSFLTVLARDTFITFNSPMNFNQYNVFNSTSFWRSYHTSLSMVSYVINSTCSASAASEYSKNIPDFWDPISSSVDYYPQVHIPFISNCQYFGANIPLFYLLNNPDESVCSIFAANETVPASMFSPSVDIKGDICVYNLSCLYSEQLDSVGDLKNWYESLATESTLFYFTRAKLDSATFQSGVIEDESISMSTSFSSDLSSDDLVAVQVSRIASSTDRGQVPRTLVLNLYYYQKDQTTKLISRATLEFADFDSDQTNIEYNLQINWQPMGWLDCLDYFAFDKTDYYFAMGVMSVILVGFVVLLWACHLPRSVVQPRPKLPWMIYVRHMFLDMLLGVILATVPVALTIRALWAVVSDGGAFDQFTGSFDDVAPIDTGSVTDLSRILTYRASRLGTLLFCMGLYICVRSVYFMLPSPSGRKTTYENMKAAKKSDQELRRQRGFLTWNVFLIVAYITPILQFANSDVFADWAVTTMVVVKLSQEVVLAICRASLDDLFLSTPLSVAMGIMGFIITLTANKFTKFLLGFVIQSGIEIVIRLYLLPYYHTIRLWIYNKRNRIVARLCKNRQVNYVPWHDHVSRQYPDHLGFHDLVRSSVELLTYGLFPAVIVFLWNFSGSLSYSLTQSLLEYFGVFAVFLLVAKVVMNSFLSHALQMRFGWRLPSMFETAQRLYAQREARWVLNDEETPHNKEYVASIRLLYRFGFSSQFFFLVAFFAEGILLMAEGSQIWMVEEYNPFMDYWFSILLLLVLSSCFVVENIIVIFASLAGFWRKPKQPEPSDADVASSRRLIQNRRANTSGIADKEFDQLVNRLRFTTLFDEESLRESILNNLRLSTKTLFDKKADQPEADADGWTPLSNEELKAQEEQRLLELSEKSNPTAKPVWNGPGEPPVWPAELLSGPWSANEMDDEIVEEKVTVKKPVAVKPRVVEPIQNGVTKVVLRRDRLRDSSATNRSINSRTRSPQPSPSPSPPPSREQFTTQATPVSSAPAISATGTSTRSILSRVPSKESIRSTRSVPVASRAVIDQSLVNRPVAPFKPQAPLSGVPFKPQVPLSGIPFKPQVPLSGIPFKPPMRTPANVTRPPQ